MVLQSVFLVLQWCCKVCVLCCSIEKIGGVLLGGDVFEYTITNLDVDLPYVILVWAFSISGDHEAARFELPAFGKERERERE